MGQLRERQKRERRDAIFEAAASLFAERGYNATSMEDVAARAGVSVPRKRRPGITGAAALDAPGCGSGSM